MKRIYRDSLVIAALMIAASFAAFAIKPTKKVADLHPPTPLTALVPERFGDWTEETVSAATIINPQQAETISRIYSEVLNRIYVNASGQRVMLSLAYGADQSDTSQIHKPEVCYPAQGFQIRSRRYDSLDAGGPVLPVQRFEMAMGQRREPVTYWIVVGDTVVKNGLEKKLVEMRYGLNGYIPDGMLFRVSSIDGDAARAFAAHDRFAADLLKAVGPAERARLVGEKVGL